MFYVYILRSQRDESLYIGYTTDVHKRLGRHNQGEVTSTKHKRPYELIFYECFANKADAKNRETYFKSGWGRRSIDRMLERTLNQHQPKKSSKRY